MFARIALTRLGSRLDVRGTCEFHVRRSARDACGFADTFFAVRGDVVLGSPHASATFAHALKANMGVEVSPAALRAMGLMHEVLHAVLAIYRQRHPEVLARLVPALEEALGADVDHTLRVMLADLPPTEVYRGRVTVDEWLARPDGDVGGRERALEELILLYVANENRAYAPIQPIIDDTELRLATAYGRIVGRVRAQLEDAPRFGPDGQFLLDMLMAPAAAAPGSIFEQLAWLRDRWGLVLADTGLLEELHIPFGMRAEEAWLGKKSHGKPTGEGSPMRFDSWARDHEYEAFSPDLDWMPRVVMIAKSTFVWLDQLTRFHGRPIRTLADVPDEELEKLSRWGITALWLIGVWRRSRASARVKHRFGNHEALASAYSLDGYDIAPELGGHDAYRVLRERAARHGIRLASDMVPNHMGVDSRWVVDHPDWFLGLDHPPYPGYRFDGPDLSDDARVGVHIEDGYWSRTDAAIVFKRVDRWTGSARYIYHGNDGTSMPWNDTAQLDYTKPEVREAVIQTILHVARMFPIIRFDAAMTLAKRHYQRLWFPLPGSEGAVPSRAEYGMTKDQFDAAIPVEFWREVVDRVAAEAPDTLLLAEAFWLMEGYFVRTLGMHRVYNSAFMNMLKKEDNLDFRMLIKNVLEFEPQVLKRFVNFMNNPDEDTAIAQFGDGDKYFGVCVLLATLPGLPMLGHGQIEGFTEKYGMEYARARHAEEPRGWMVERHEREIFPLLRRRYLFADVERFRLFDAVTDAGTVCEDVIAYTNGHGSQKALVAYNNRYASARVRLRESVPFRGAGGDLARSSLVEALGLAVEEGLYLVARDVIAQRDHVYEVQELAIAGLPMELGAFRFKVLLDFRVEREAAGAPWGELARRLDGAGTRSADDALAVVAGAAVLDPLRIALGAAHARYLETASEEDIVKATRDRFVDLAKGAAYEGSRAFAAAAYGDACADLLWAARERVADASPPWHMSVAPLRVATAVLQIREAVRCLARVPRFDALVREVYTAELGEREGLALADLVVSLVAAVPGDESRPASVPPPPPPPAASARSVPPPPPPVSASPETLPSRDVAFPPPPLAAAAADAAAEPPPVRAQSVSAPSWFPPAPSAWAAPPLETSPLVDIVRGALLQRFLGVHEWEGVTYFGRERFECLLTALVVVGDLDPLDAHDLAALAERTGYDFAAFCRGIGTGQMSRKESSLR